MVCTTCGAENRAGRRYCARCAAPLPRVCAGCAAPNEPDALFCGECAAPLGTATTAAGPTDHVPAIAESWRAASATAAVPPPPAVTARAIPEPGLAIPDAVGSSPSLERRLVTILFADLAGFTPYAEGRDAEQVRDVLSHYFETASAVIQRHGGVVEKFIGDAVMAVWGAPVAREDDAERAVRAGLELVDAVRALGPPMQAHAGILSGEAVVTLRAVGQGMVAGDVVNTASRLESVAPAGAVLVGEATMRMARSAIAFEAVGQQELKGKAWPVVAWRALRVVARRGGRDRVDALEPPFVGRDAELRLLKELFHATSDERRARLVSVVGQTGIGKSRLAWEFRKYVDGLVETVWWHEGRSPAYGDGVTFWALGEMVRGRCGLLEGDDEETTRMKVAETLAAHVPDQAERRWLERSLLSLLGIERMGRASEELFASWRTFLERLAATAPVVLVFEDLHDADPGTIDFVDYLVDRSRGVPIYVLTLARPDLLERRPGWGAGKRAFASLFLEPLPNAAIRELLTGTVPGLPAAAIRAIVGRADGVPLYAVEILRSLIADGRLVPHDGMYVGVGDLGSLSVPETLTALVAARLDSLPRDERALVSDAAVLGQSFTLPALVAVSGVAEGDLEPRLGDLVRREFLTFVSDRQDPEHGQYAFVQSLTREVAYETLAKPDRVRRHLAAARHFESLGGDEIAGVLAGQYVGAMANAPEGAEADGLRRQARLALGAAAERAAALGSHAQALAFLERALAITSDADEAATLHERVPASAGPLERYDEAEAHLRAALARQVEIGDRHAQARVTAALGQTILYERDLPRALELLVEASARFADLGDDPARTAIDAELARAYLLNLEPERAVALADRVLPAAERRDLVEVLADTLVTRGSALVVAGRRYEGTGVLEAGQRLARAYGHGRVELRAANELAVALLDIDPRAGLEAAVAGLQLARRVGERTSLLLHVAFLLALRLGDWDRAASLGEPLLDDEVDLTAQAAALSVAISLQAYRGEAADPLMTRLEALAADKTDTLVSYSLLVSRLDVAWAHGRYDLARRLAHELARSDPNLVSYGFALAAHAALLAGDRRGSGRDLEELDSRGGPGRALDADRLTIQAGHAALDDAPAEALRLYRQALVTWRELGLAWDHAQCTLEMATLLDPRHPEVRAAAERGREILVGLRARPFIERLDAALTRGVPVPSA